MEIRQLLYIIFRFYHRATWCSHYSGVEKACMIHVEAFPTKQSFPASYKCEFDDLLGVEKNVFHLHPLKKINFQNAFLSEFFRERIFHLDWRELRIKEISLMRHIYPLREWKFLIFHDVETWKKRNMKNEEKREKRDLQFIEPVSSK